MPSSVYSPDTCNERVGRRWNDASSPCAREFPRLSEVGERPADCHNLIVELIVEIGEIQERPTVEEPLLDSAVEADALLRLQMRIVSECQFKTIRGANARPEAPVHSRRAEPRSGIRLASHVRCGHARIQFGDGAGGNEGTRSGIIAG